MRKRITHVKLLSANNVDKVILTMFKALSPYNDNIRFAIIQGTRWRAVTTMSQRQTRE